MGTCKRSEPLPAQRIAYGAFHHVLPIAAPAAAAARIRFAGFLEHNGVGGQLAADITLAVGEALANSVEHGYREGGTIELSAAFLAHGIEVRLADNGPGFAPGARPQRPPDATDTPRGFGIFLMHALMDEVEFTPDGTAVRLFKALDRGSA